MIDSDQEASMELWLCACATMNADAHDRCLGCDDGTRLRGDDGRDASHEVSGTTR
jgi:hypothetical protein